MTAADLINQDPKIMSIFLSEIFRTNHGLKVLSSNVETKSPYEENSAREETQLISWINSLGIDVRNLFEEIRDG